MFGANWLVPLDFSPAGPDSGSKVWLESSAGKGGLFQFTMRLIPNQNPPMRVELSTLDQERHRLEAKPLSWNRSAALESVGGDESLLNEVMQIFLVESPTLVTQMEEALLHHDPRMLELAAHSLKGELGYLGVPEASEAAQELEDAGRTGEMEGAADLLAELRTRLEVLWTVVGENAGV
jgi:HPt (histidine-containing phosphotransfer) domain-containing protein